MHCGVIIQARLDSTRLCHKVFKPIRGQTVLDYVIDAAQRCRFAKKVVVTTPDVAICRYVYAFSCLCQPRVVPYFYDGPRDPLGEYYAVAKNQGLDLVVRLTADCPMLTGEIIDVAIQAFLDSPVDCLYNGTDGADVEVFTRDALEKAHSCATTTEEREHVCLWMKRNLIYKELSPMPGGYKSLDTPEDYAYICGVMGKS